MEHKKNTIIIIQAIFIICLLILDYNKANDYSKTIRYKDEQIKSSNKRIDSVLKSHKALDFTLDSIKKVYPYFSNKQIEVDSSIEINKNKRHEIKKNRIVRTYVSPELDSVLTNYRFEPRTKDNDSKGIR